MKDEEFLALYWKTRSAARRRKQWKKLVSEHKSLYRVRLETAVDPDKVLQSWIENAKQAYFRQKQEVRGDNSEFACLIKRAQFIRRCLNGDVLR